MAFLKKLVTRGASFLNKNKGHIDTFLRKAANSATTVANYVSKTANNPLMIGADIVAEEPGLSAQLREGAHFGQQIAKSAKYGINKLRSGLKNSLEIMDKKPEEKSHFV